MKHSIREHIVDPIRGKIVKVSTINAELGSGILDKNGKEIFEGDIVVVKRYPNTKMPVSFEEGMFYARISSDGRRTALATHQSTDLEVVGHVDD